MTFRMVERGMTLVELAFVALLLGLIVMLVWPNLRRYARATLARAESDQVRTRLRDARLQAMLDRRPITIDLTMLKGLRASPPRVCVYPDGSADPVTITPTAGRFGAPEITMDAGGRIEEK